MFAAIREVKEETGLDIANPVVTGVCLLAKQFSGALTLMEPEKCSGWLWCDPANLPEPHFEASRKAIACYLEGKFYRQG